MITQKIVSKILFYLNKISMFSSLVLYHQIILALCPSFLRYSTKKGWFLFLFLILFSFLHYRLFHIFFVLVLLQTKLPNENDKKFYRELGFYLVVLSLWFLLNFQNEMGWVDII